jgi:Putative lumazine-binding
MNTLLIHTIRQAARLAAVTVAAGVAAPAHATPDTTGGAARPLIEAFADAADRRDVSALEGMLHPDFRVVFNQKAGGPATQLSRAQYLQLLRDGKIGGKPRAVTVLAVSGVEGFAAASTWMEHDSARFQGMFSLIQRDGRWWLLQETVLMLPRAAAENVTR